MHQRHHSLSRSRFRSRHLLRRLQGPLVRGPAGVCPLGRVVHTHLHGCLPGSVLVPLVVLIDVHACGCVLLPIELMRTVSGNIPP